MSKMQSSLFDIFGEESRKTQTSRQTPGSHIFKGPGIENLKAKSVTASNSTTKNALGDIGNIQRKAKVLQEKVKPNDNQENASSTLLTRTPLQKSKISLQTPNVKPVEKTRISFQTPNVKPVVRSPLSDLLPRQQPLISAYAKSIEKSQAGNLEKMDEFLNGDFNDPECCDQDNFSPQDDDDTDIIPKSGRLSDEEIYKLVNFWQMSKGPVDIESDEDLPVEDNTDFLFESSPSPFDMDLKEPFLVPVFDFDEF